MTDDNASRDSRPVPDPTLLTTQQLLRENAALKEIVFTRLDGMDKAIVVFNESITRVPTDTDKQISTLKALHEEKFKSIDAARVMTTDLVSEKFRSVEIQFKERDVRDEQTRKDSKVAVDAALQAAKEAVGEQNKSNALSITKSEATTAKQIDQLLLLIGDVKERLTRIEGKGEGTATTHASNSAATQFVIGICITIGLAILGLILKFVK